MRGGRIAIVSQPRDPRCVLTVAMHDFNLVFEGEAVKVVDEAKLNRIAEAYAETGRQPTVPALRMAEPYGETRVRIQSQ